MTSGGSAVFRDDLSPKSHDGTIDCNPQFLMGQHETHGLRQHRGILNMEGMMSLPKEAFEISEASFEVDMRKFAYKRSARQSVMLDLGVAPVKPAQQDTKLSACDVIDPYSKSSAFDCLLTYCAVMIGLTTFDLTEAVGKCGFIPGVTAIIAYSIIHCFLCHRLVEVPQLTEQNLEYYTDIAKACFNRLGYKLVTSLTICCWFAMCMITLHSTAEWSKRLFMGEMPLLWQLCTTWIVVLVGVKTSAKGLHQAARYSLVAVLGASIIECAFAVAYGLTHRHVVKHTWIGDFHGIVAGLTQMAWAFTGVGILPYVLAAMLNPVDAKRVTTHACQYCCVFYVAVTTICFSGLGNASKGGKNTVEMLSQGGLIAKFLAAILSLFCIVKTLVSYKLFFWPFIQEVERSAALNDAPAVVLQLPWAIRRAYYQKSMVRLLLIFATLGPIYVDFSPINAWMHVPVMAVHYLLPALFPVFATHIHRKHVRQQQRRSMRTSVRNADDLPYFCRHFLLHLVTTHIVAVILCCTCVYFTAAWFLSAASFVP